MATRRLLISGLAAVFLTVTISLAQQAHPPTAKRTQGTANSALRTAAKPAAPAPAGMPVEQQQALVKQYCSGCHNDKLKSGGMSLTQLDLASPEKNPELAEKVIKKLRVGLMPPAGMPRPEASAVKSLVTTLEASMDREAALHPNPGKRGFQRLTRTEYARSIHELFGIDEDIAALLPPDSLSGDGFDNLADAQGFSATLNEGYMRAAAKVTRDALGDPKATPTSDVFRLPRMASQMEHVEGTPAGTRGGISIVYNFPADGEYNFRSMMYPNSLGALLGSNIKGEQLDVAIDGARIALLEIDQRRSEERRVG